MTLKGAFALRRSGALPELLAPAGDFECLVAAVRGGADAIYVGGKRFGARAFAKNFDMDELARATDYCHLHGVRIYVTVNTLVEDRELPELVEYAAELYRIGVDALIVADIGAVAVIKRCVPGLTLHASTQMSAHNVYGVNVAAELGVSRVVVARELSLTDIRTVCEESDCEIEVFLHGALCVCYSGQCLFSSLVGGRSGNRGECAQPCRLPFNGKYPLSLKDMSLASHIPALIECGVSSLKIEGRMKSPSYVYTVTKIYRRLLDGRRSATAEEREELRRAFSRGGFTDGYFVGRTESAMTGVRSEEDKRDSRDAAIESFAPARIKVTARAKMRLDEPSEMTLTDGKREARATGAIPTAAQNSPLEPDSVRVRLSKMGNTFLSLSPDDIDLTLDGGVNLAPSQINALRREAAELFESSRREPVAARYTPKTFSRSVAPLLTAQFFSGDAFTEAYSRDADGFSGFDIIFLPLFADSYRYANGVAIPPVIFDSELTKIKERLEYARKCGIMYALVGNIAQISLVKEFGLTPVGDFRLNITNAESAAVYAGLGISHYVLSPELTLPQARDIGGAVITYGRIPLMITERCFIRENFGCKRCGSSSLVDRRGEKFPMIREFEHRNIILNSVPTYIGDRKKELSANRINSHHLVFTVESPDEILTVIRAHISGAPIDTRVRRAGRRKQ